jgi:cation:H+ antiporter
MSALSLSWAQFVVCLVVIGIGGFRLAYHGDALAELTGLSRNWIGLVLLASVTSLPELFTGLSAVTFACAPDIAVGDALGSCVFNLFIFALVELLQRGEPPYGRASQGHVITAAFGAISLAVAGLGLTLAPRAAVPNVAHVSVISVVLIALYLIAMRVAFNFERHAAPDARRSGADPQAVRRALVGYATAAVVVVAAGTWLPFIGVQLAESMGWSKTFVGTQFIALATSAPELATTLAAVRIGAIELAIGNLLGSNLFDVLILAIDDIAWLEGSIFAAASTLHLVSVLTAIMMSGAVSVALVVRPSRRVWHTLSWAGIALSALYLLNGWILFRHGQ